MRQGEQHRPRGFTCIRYSISKYLISLRLILAVTDISELRKKRRQRKIIDVLFKGFILAVIVLLGLSLIVTKDRWYPRLSGILAGTPFGNRDVTVDSEGFPVKIPENSSSFVVETEGGFAVLTDTRLTVYKDDADAVLDVSHDLISPVVTADGVNTLLYDLGGKKFRFYGEKKLLFEKSAEFPIQLGRASGSKCAVITEHDRYLSDLTVYDKTGTLLWNYKSINRITDVTFTEDGSSIYITVSDSREGDLVSKILCYSFGEAVKDEEGNAVPLYESDFIKTFALKTELFGIGNLILIGDRETAIFDRQCKLIDFTVYNNNIADFSSESDTEGNANAFVLEDDGTVLIVDSHSNSFRELKLSGNAERISAGIGQFTVLTELDVTRYGSGGTVMAKSSTDGSYRDIISKDDFSLLVGFEDIIRIEI
jgi:hypothetical protein